MLNLLLTDDDREKLGNILSMMADGTTAVEEAILDDFKDDPDEQFTHMVEAEGERAWLRQMLNRLKL